MNVSILPAVTLALRMTSTQLVVLIQQLDGSHVVCAVGTDASAKAVAQRRRPHSFRFIYGVLNP